MKRQRILSAAVVCVVACAFLMGCGDDDGNDGPSFAPCSETFAACGGDPTGGWTLAGMCDPLAPFRSMCDEMVITVTRDESVGTDTFNADGSYALNVSYDVEFTALAPKSCIPGETCDFLLAVDTFESVTDLGEECDYVGHYVKVVDEAGTWRMDGNNLMTTVNGATIEDTTEICINGDIGEALNSDGTRFQWQR